MTQPTSALLEDLNPIQQEAVKATDGPTLVLAGAGSGKTRVLTYKVAYLIGEKKIQPERILIVTFTNKAAGEMRDRILKLLNSELITHNSALPLMGTFHSICARILRKEGFALGLKPGFSIYDENDALDAIKEAMGNLNIATQKTNPSSIRHTISGAKNELISDIEYPQYARGYFQEIVANVYLEYQKILRRNSALDFDDLLMYTIKLFETNPQTLAKYQNQFEYILVDEYQDTNAAQYQLIKLLAKRNRNLCVVGDAAQAIYGFRGADFRNIVNFQKDYPEAKVFNLEQNYRSTQTILDAAHSVISENKTHPILTLWTDKKEGPKISLYQARSEVEEALFIIDRIRRLMGGAEEGSRASTAANDNERGRTRDTEATGPINLSSFALLYRTNAQSRALEEAFLKSGVPYKLTGGVQFYERKEIKDVLSYLKLVANPDDSIARKRIEKIGKGRAQKFYELLPTFVRGDSEEGSRASTAGGLLTSEDALGKLRRQDPEQTTMNIMDQILTTTGYLAYLDDGTEQGKMRVENVKELRSVAEEFPDLTQFLEQVPLVENGNLPNHKRKT
ncbi:MAG: ATP-dependent DNA helicase Rep, partial [Candidatus Daviesbacteria bacterium GW2011_GWA1_36_8]